MDREPTPTQAEALRAYMAHGSYKLAGAQLGLSAGTVRRRMERLRARLGASSTLEAARKLAPEEYEAMLDKVKEAAR